MSKKVLAIACTFLLLLSLVGCDKAASLIDQAGQAVGEAVGEALSDPAQAETDNEIDKQNAYIDLYNELVGSLYTAIDDYSGEFGWEEKVDIDKDFDGFSMYSTTTDALLEAALPYADKEPLEPEADAALKALAGPLSEYSQALTDAKDYYDTKGYVDDKYEKAQAYHDIIFGKYDAIEALVSTFLQKVDIMLEGQTEEQLEYYKSGDMMVHYYGLLCLELSQQMMAYLHENEITAETILDVNLDEFRPVYDEFAAACAEYAKVATAEAAKAEGITSTTMFDIALKDIKACSAELVQRVENKKNFSSSDLNIADLTDGTPDKLGNLVDDLLSNYNSWFA